MSETETLICHCCGQPIPEPIQRGISMEDIAARCEELKIKIIPEGLVWEADAAKLLNYASADTLRKQVYERRNLLNFKNRGNRRLYFLDEIRLHL